MRTLVHPIWAALLTLVFLGAGLPRSAGLVLCVGCDGDVISVGEACGTFQTDECCSHEADADHTAPSPLAGSHQPASDCGCIDLPLGTDPSTARDRVPQTRPLPTAWPLLAHACMTVADTGPTFIDDGEPPPRAAPLERRTVLIL